MDLELDNYAEAYIGIHEIFAHMCNLLVIQIIISILLPHQLNFWMISYFITRDKRGYSLIVYIKRFQGGIQILSKLI